MKKRLLALILALILAASLLPVVAAAEGTGERIEIDYSGEPFYGTVDQLGVRTRAVGVDSAWLTADDCFGDQFDHSQDATSLLAKAVYDKLVRNALDNNIVLDNDGFLVFDISEAEVPTSANVSKGVFGAIAAFVYDYPEQASLSYTGNIWTLPVGDFITQVGIKIEPIGDIVQRKEDLLAAVDDFYDNHFLKDSADKLGELDQYRYIHDWLCDQTYYNRAAVSDSRIIDAHTAYGALVGSSVPLASYQVLRGNVVCEGYARAYQLLCDRAGLTAIAVAGYAYPYNPDEDGHAWNYIKLSDGKWYAVDATWDDVDWDIVTLNGYDTPLEMHFAVSDNLAVGNQTISKKHLANGVLFWLSGWCFGYPGLEADDKSFTTPYEYIRIDLTNRMNYQEAPTVADFGYVQVALNTSFSFLEESGRDPVVINQIPKTRVVLLSDALAGDTTVFSGSTGDRELIIQSGMRNASGGADFADLAFGGSGGAAMFNYTGKLSIRGVIVGALSGKSSFFGEVKSDSELHLLSSAIAYFRQGGVLLNGKMTIERDAIINANTDGAGNAKNVTVNNGGKLCIMNDLGEDSRIGITPVGLGDRYQLTLQGDLYPLFEAPFPMLYLDSEGAAELTFENGEVFYSAFRQTPTSAAAPVAIRYPSGTVSQLAGKTFSLVDAASTDVAYVAFYKEGKLVGVSAPTPNLSGEFTIGSVPTGADTCRIFVVTNTNTKAPRSNVAEISNAS